MILTDERGRPFERPCREDFEPGIEGEIAWMRAVWAYKDAVTNEANRAFVAGFRGSRDDSAREHVVTKGRRRRAA